MSDFSRQAPKISVIVPVYHVEKYLRCCLDSILGQSFEDFELILINDGGNEAETAICEEFAKSDDRIVYLYQDNAGLSAARNAGLDICKGEWVTFVDSDDWLFPNALEEAIRAVEQTAADMVIFEAQYEMGNCSFVEQCPFEPGTYMPDEILTGLASLALPPYAWNKYCLRELYAGISFPEGEKWEDVATTFRAVARARRVVVLDKPLYHYRQRSDAITKAASKDNSACKWRFLQYRKRYEALKTMCPEAAASARQSIIVTGILYCSTYLLGGEHARERQDVRSYLLSSEFATVPLPPREKAAYLLLRICHPLLIALFKCRRYLASLRTLQNH